MECRENLVKLKSGRKGWKEWVEAGGPIGSGGTEKGWEWQHIQGKGDQRLRGAGGRLRGEREKVERVSYGRGREKIFC